MRGTHRGRLALCVACLGLVSFLASVSCLSIQLHLLGVSRRSSSRSSLAATTETTMADDEATLSIRYSCSFQRHIVTECKSSRQRVVASYEFLDEAQEAHPTAFVMPLVGEGWVVAPVAGGGLEETTSYATGEEESNTTDAQDCSFMESLCVVLGENRARALVASIPSTRFAGLTPDIVRTRYQHLQFLLQARLGLNSVFGIIQNFPQVLLYNPRDVEERLDFLLAPLPPLVSGNGNLDWPLMAFCGYGAGWTVDQVCRALQAVPHVVLALFLEDVAVMKPPLVHFLTSLQMTYPNVDQVHLQLDPWIGGDVYTFAYLKEKVGLEWIHLSVMLQAFPCLAVCDTEPTWEMLGSVRSILNYLQRRLQIRPTTVQAMIKVSMLNIFSTRRDVSCILLMSVTDSWAIECILSGRQDSTNVECPAVPAWPVVKRVKKGDSSNAVSDWYVHRRVVGQRIDPATALFSPRRLVDYGVVCDMMSKKALTALSFFFFFFFAQLA